MANSAGGQLYAQIAGLLAPAESVEGTKSMVILEPAGKDVAPLAAGTPEAIEALADLANTIPLAAPTFLDSGGVYDDIWRFVLRSASPTGPADDPVRDTLANLISDNRADFELMARARLDVPGDTYHPVLADPRSWLDDDGWTDVAFRIGGEHPDPPPATPPSVFVPPEIPELEWRLVEPIEPDPLVIPEYPGPGGSGGIDGPDPIDPSLWKESVLVDQLRSAIVLRSDAADVADLAVLRPEMVELADRVAFQVDDAAVVPHFERSLALRASAVTSLRRLRAPGETAMESADTDHNPAAFVLADDTRWKDLWTAARVIDTTGPVAAPELEGSGFELRFQFRVVGIRRPWIQQQLLRLSGWSLPGLAAEGISNGRPVDNPGLMPVLTTRMLVVRRLFLKAEWSESDRERASQVKSLAFGPFTVAGGEAFDGTELRREAPQVVAWLGQVLPASPPG